MALCDSHSGSLWLLLTLSGFHWLSWLLLDLSLSLSGSLWLFVTPTLALIATLWHTLALSAGSLLLSYFTYTTLDRFTGPLLDSHRWCHDDALYPALHFVVRFQFFIIWSALLLTILGYIWQSRCDRTPGVQSSPQGFLIFLSSEVKCNPIILKCTVKQLPLIKGIKPLIWSLLILFTGDGKFSILTSLSLWIENSMQWIDII